MKKILASIALLASSLSFANDNSEITYLEYPEKGEYLFSSEGVDNEVVLFFSTNCGACYSFRNFENLISKYIINENDRYEKIPVSFYPSWDRGRELHFLIKNNYPNLSDDDIYSYIHEQKRPLKTQYDIIDFFAFNNIEISERDLLRMLEETRIKYQIKISEKISKDLQIDTTPSIVITKSDGRRFLLTPEGGGFTNMIKAAAIIVNEEKKE